MSKEFAYHCTDVDPKVIIKDGFKATGKGFTADRVADVRSK